MFLFFSDNFQLGIDCVAAMPDDRHLVFGWTMTPRGVPVTMKVAGGDGREGRVDYRFQHPRLDVVPTDPDQGVVSGFVLSCVKPPGGSGLVLTLQAGDLSGRANLLDASISTDLYRATGERDWQITYRFLQEAAQRPEALPMFRYMYRPYGAFADWMARLPMARGHIENHGALARLDVVTSPAGEFMLTARFQGRPQRRISIDTVAVAFLRAEDGGPDEVRLVPLADRLASQNANIAGIYGRVPLDLLDRLRAIEVVAQIVFDDERIWLRCQPHAESLPGFLDAVCASPGPGIDPGIGLASLQAVLQRREAAFAPFLTPDGALAGSGGAKGRSPDEPGGGGTAAVLVGLDDAFCVPLLHAVAPMFEQRCQEVILLGRMAHQVEQVFSRRGGVRAATETDTATALGRAALEHTAVVPLDAGRLALAVQSGMLEAMLDFPMEAGDLALLRVLHAAAGCGQLADSLGRLLRIRETQMEAGWQPVSHAWKSPLAAQPVNAHLQRLWRIPAQPTLVEAPLS